MAKLIRMPDLGTTVDRLTVVEWLVEPGQTVEQGQPLMVVETDKAASELESVASGTLLRRLADAGDEVQQGQAIAVVGERGEDVDSLLREEAESGVRHATEPTVSSDRPAGGGPRVSPMVRNLARKLGVDLTAVAGTGPGGTVTRDDLLAVGGEGAKPRGGDAEAGHELSDHQRAVGQSVLRSKQTVPHFYLTCAVDMTEIEATRRRHLDASGTKLHYDAFFVRAAGLALRDFDRMACRFEDGALVRSGRLSVSVAMDIADELYVPTIKDADRLSVPEISSRITELAERISSGKLLPADSAPACLTVSNLGGSVVEEFCAIINSPQSAILAVGRSQPTPIVEEGRIVARNMANMTLSVDHRVANGRYAARYLGKVKDLLERETS